MEIEVLGIGNAFTSRYYNTSFLIKSEFLYLVDCPQGLFRLLRERGISPADIDRIIVTHVHGDHTAGLETLLLWKKYSQRVKPILYTSHVVYQELKDKFFPRFASTFTPDLEGVVDTEPEDYADFRELKEDVENQVDRNLKIELRYNWHPTPTLGLRLSTSRGVIGLSGDTCYRPELLKRLCERDRIDRRSYEKLAGPWLWDCDLIYHEVDASQNSLHTAESDLLALPVPVRRKIRLIHLADDFTSVEFATAREGEVAALRETGGVVIRPPRRVE